MKTMRKVMFKEWIPAKFPDGAGTLNWTSPKIEGTGCWDTEFTAVGVFHQWAASYEEFESGAGNFTVALVELPNGEMKEVLPSNIKFVDL